MAHILVIDDSPTFHATIGAMLRKHGHECVFETNGEAGIATATAIQPDVILMDIIMPGMSGFQATRVISKKSETSHIPVIIVSTKDQPSDKVWGLRQGACDYLVKEFSEDALIHAINQVLKK
ncbi:response regulator transcription factor [Agitococcus lubricus]|uniref:Twitching motility two-component system response regulator PilH n=1 Tax=Agitococcus lubricus TaxID=1077255 RepID=A0A2T5IZC3_9GAMM|nr:response regulator [Agitococcus lubricus]PTQ89398.1 twitching motility two-component system response regulator PilH [Agitococcus lubricus]